MRSRNATANCALVASRWHDAGARRGDAVIALEGEATFAGVQRFLSTVQRLSSERRLSRYAFPAMKRDGGTP